MMVVPGAHQTSPSERNKRDEETERTIDLKHTLVSSNLKPTAELKQAVLSILFCISYSEHKTFTLLILLYWS